MHAKLALSRRLAAVLFAPLLSVLPGCLLLLGDGPPAPDPDAATSADQAALEGDTGAAGDLASLPDVGRDAADAGGPDALPPDALGFDGGGDGVHSDSAAEVGLGLEGDSCTGPADCDPLAAPFCAPDARCHDGSLGDPCTDDRDCIATAAGPLVCGAPGCHEEDFVRLTGGTFTMGCPDGSGGDDDDVEEPDPDCPPADATPLTPVTLTRSLYAQTREVTQEEWSRLMGGASFHNDACASLDDCSLPADKISFYGALQYANALSAAAGLPLCYELDCSGPSQDPSCSSVAFAGLDCLGYRLPAEAEWEYLARAGTTSDYYSGDVGPGQNECDDRAPDHLGDIAWFCGNAAGGTQPVATRTPNAWGLHDMAGNVGEWVWDVFDAYPEGLLVDPTGPDSGRDRVVRGGWYSRRPAELQHGARAHFAPDDARREVGLRLVRTAPE